MATEFDNVVRVLIVLAFVAVLYDRFVVDVIERHLPSLGMTAWEVVGGVLFTLVGFAFLAGVEAFLLALLCFAASGIPMILGSRARHLEPEPEG